MATQKTVKIKYLKAHDFKTSLTTGVYGGITGNGLINVNFFTDRAVIPDYQQVDVDDKGRTLGIPKDVRDSDAIREVQFGTMMDINTAKVIVAWLDSKIDEHDKFIKDQNA